MMASQDGVARRNSRCTGRLIDLRMPVRGRVSTGSDPVRTTRLFLKARPNEGDLALFVTGHTP